MLLFDHLDHRSTSEEKSADVGCLHIDGNLQGMLEEAGERSKDGIEGCIRPTHYYGCAYRIRCEVISSAVASQVGTSGRDNKTV